MTLHHVVEGPEQAPLVVLAGGLGTTLEMWELQLPALATRFRVLRYDQPGHGRSPIPETASISAFARHVLELVGDERFAFVGLSMGGAIGMQLALEAPERCERLVLCCTAARFATPEFWDQRAAAVRAGGVGAVADVVLDRWFTPAFPDVRRYREMLVSTPAEGYARCSEALRDWDARGTLGSIRAPTLAIAGDEDPATPPADLQAIAAEVSRTRVVVLENARHLANVERADDFNSALLSFL